MFCKKGVLWSFTKFTGKHLCQSHFFNKVAGLRSTTLLKKKLWHRYFPVIFAKFLRTPFFKEQFWWLLLNIYLKLIDCVISSNSRKGRELVSSLKNSAKNELEMSVINYTIIWTDFILILFSILFSILKKIEIVTSKMH